MTTTTATLRMLLLICISLGQIRVSMQVGTTKVPKDGVYLITMVADPDGRTDMFLQFNGHDSGFVAYGLGDAVAGLVVAVYLKANTKVGARFTGDSEGASTLGVGYVSNEKDDFVTVRSNGHSSGATHVSFQHQYTADGHWKSTEGKTHFKINKDGIYWVSARPDCGNSYVSLNVGPGDYFNVFCNGDKAISASGAFRLLADRELQLVFNKGNYLQGGTSFSFVYLEGNQFKYIRKTWYIAYTAWMDKAGWLSANDKLSFNDRFTNFGTIYDSTQLKWTVMSSGTYIVSMRGDPNSNTLKVILYKNQGEYVFAWFNEEGTKSGQAGIFNFWEGEELYFVDPYGSYVGNETFMSFALLRLAS